MKRPWLPHPYMAATLAAAWLLLVGSARPGHLVAAAAFGLVITRLTRSFWPQRPRVPRLHLLARYALRVVHDIVVANFRVVRLVLGPRSRLRPAFVEVPIELQDEFAIILLVSTISLAPGTVVADLRPDRRTLLVHALDAPDPAALVQTIKQRYEQPLKEMFG